LCSLVSGGNDSYTVAHLCSATWQPITCTRRGGVPLIEHTLEPGKGFYFDLSGDAMPLTILLVVTG
jgi:hypothetical protein